MMVVMAIGRIRRRGVEEGGLEKKIELTSNPFVFLTVS